MKATSGCSQSQRRRPNPQSPVFTRLSPKTLHSRDRFGYWRELFVSSYVDRSQSVSKGSFRGEMRGCADDRGTVFANVRTDPVVYRFGGRDSGLIVIGCVRRGTLTATHGDKVADLNADSGLILLDCDGPTTIRSTAHELACLALSRSMVVETIGHDPLPPGVALSRFPQSGLARILLTHLQALAEHGEGLDTAGTAAVMQGATALALALLAGLIGAPHEQRTSLDDGLFAAARRHIELNSWKHDLTAASIAAAIGCSRAHLYRLFAARGETVAGYLRDVRLMHARSLLEAEPSQPIGTIAFNIGYTDLSAFGKAFKRRFGAAPRDWREMAAARMRLSMGRQSSGE